MPESNKKWIAFGDVHQSLRFIDLLPDLEEADGVIITGDLTNHSPEGAIEKVWDSVYRRNQNILAQLGNMDRSNVTEFLKEKGANLHCEVRELADGIKTMGVGCSINTPFRTPSEISEDEMAQYLEETHHQLGDYDQLLLVVHDAPFNTKLDVIANGMHVGSKAVRCFIEKHQPDIVLCGHIHESSGVDSLGKSRIFNPGMASGGGYVLVSIENGKLDATLKQI
ncbi:metallophosphoesterase family protein [Maridesulfovibrio salexigens]|uniref:Metallophosphoesterase n=1 Tax=Maridesulfovibrio salexigens (strain ATCC 14822 / DSM 2638 / NCIMB 8403 / VKM B-1763) TaxID=526222 RepID=C6BU52_MARSD|nr:metallophosphoesterase [Maridesulfovibrio salexigens]ACS81761.1 metallophosphoesterase [Maridesulfovibrio salexigens DSM 2638]